MKMEAVMEELVPGLAGAGRPGHRGLASGAQAVLPGLLTQAVRGEADPVDQAPRTVRGQAASLVPLIQGGMPGR